MRPNRYVSVLLLALSAILPSVAPEGAAKTHREYLVYFGTYTDKGSKGIYACRFRPSTGKLTPVELAAETVSPSFLAVDPAQRFLFAANEIGDYQNAKSGSVSSFAIDRHTGKLRTLNTVASRGADPCHLTVDKNGSHVLVANYTGGSVAVLPIKPAECWAKLRTLCSIIGSSVDPDRQHEPHAHDVVLTPDNRFAVVADLGLDKLMVYRYDLENGKLSPNDPPFGSVKPGSGPRHFALHPNGRWAYVINEMGNTDYGVRLGCR
jgi:6-phosphogluconolactonase